MKKLLKYLSPFAPDQSGACGVLYELGGLIVICDAGGCSGNICGFDEPRWFTKGSAVFSAGLRDMDAIMGRDDKLIEKLKKAQEDLGGRFSALIATPVPAVIGTDMKALKRMAEKALGVPCITANAIGTKSYDAGEEETWLNLFKEFAGKTEYLTKNESADEKALANSQERLRGKKQGDVHWKMGVLGATPLETGYSREEDLREFLKADSVEKCEMENSIIFGIGSGLDGIINSNLVEKNLVVSVAGLKTAEYMKSEFGIPYQVGFPFIPAKVKEEVSSGIQKLMETEKDRLRILILHTQFAANELRKYIRNLDSQEHSGLNDISNMEIDCATFFKQSQDYAEEGDFTLSGEDDLWEKVSEKQYDLIIGDGDMERLIRAAGFKGILVDFPHFAVSGRMNDDSVMFFS